MTSAVPSSSVPAPPGDCAICKKPRSGSRCDQCGAAAAPGGFKVVRLISQSPRGRLYLAQDTAGLQVALKELVFASVPSVAMIDGFEREAAVLEQLSHPQIPRFVRHFREGEGIHLRFYLAQEFVPGQSLLERVGSQRFKENDVKTVARQILGVLAYLHSLSPRVLHRDIKPANIMRKPDGQLVLVDFDCARDLPRGITYGSTLVGTFGYMPPEQLGGTVDVTSDLYALGASLIHLLSRKPPSELMAPGMRLAFEDKVSVSQGFKQWLARMVEVDPNARFPSAAEARAALDAPPPAPKPQPVPVQVLPPKNKKEKPAPPPVKIHSKPSRSERNSQPVGFGTSLIVTVPLLLVAAGMGYCAADVKKKPVPVPAYKPPVTQAAARRPSEGTVPDSQFHRLAHLMTSGQFEVRVFGAMVSPTPPPSLQASVVGPDERWIVMDVEVKNTIRTKRPAPWRDWARVRSVASTCQGKDCVVIKPYDVRYGRNEGNSTRYTAHKVGVTFEPDIVLPLETRQVDVFFAVPKKAFPLALELEDGTQLPLKLAADP